MHASTGVPSLHEIAFFPLCCPCGRTSVVLLLSSMALVPLRGACIMLMEHFLISVSQYSSGFVTQTLVTREGYLFLSHFVISTPCRFVGRSCLIISAMMMVVRRCKFLSRPHSLRHKVFALFPLPSLAINWAKESLTLTLPCTAQHTRVPCVTTEAALSMSDAIFLCIIICTETFHVWKKSCFSHAKDGEI